MPRAASAESEPVNADSFLNIVASVVSIMIIMVLMVGLKIKNTPVEAPTLAIAGADAGPGDEAAAAEATQRDARQTAGQLERLQKEVAAAREQRDALVLAVAGAEASLEAVRRPGVKPIAQDPALLQELSEAKFTLEQLDRRRAAVQMAPGEVVQVNNFPTPLSQEVHGEEIHFQLRGGRLAFIPMDEFMDRLQSDVKHQAKDNLEKRSRYTETIGPIEGFCLRYTIVRRDLTPEEARRHGGPGFYTVLKHGFVIPVSETLGEPVEAALRADSRFRRILAEHADFRPVVTIWTYPEGFAAFRRIKDELHRLGFATAGRPLQPDMPIGLSSEGSRSSAE